MAWKHLLSCVFALERAIEIGILFLSGRTWYFVPSLPRFVDYFPVSTPFYQRHNAYQIQRLKSLIDTSKVVRALKSCLPEFLKYSCAHPFVIMPMTDASRSILARQHLPLTPRSKHVEYPIEYGAVRNLWSDMCALVVYLDTEEVQ